MSTRQQSFSRFTKLLFSWKSLRQMIYAYSAATVFSNYVGVFIFCSGDSMLPTLQGWFHIFFGNMFVAAKTDYSLKLILASFKTNFD